MGKFGVPSLEGAAQCNAEGLCTEGPVHFVRQYLNAYGLMRVQVAPPAFLPVPGPRGLYQQGHGIAAFLNSRGEVTAYSPHGERLWQVNVSPSSRRASSLQWDSLYQASCLRCARELLPWSRKKCTGTALQAGAVTLIWSRFALQQTLGLAWSNQRHGGGNAARRVAPTLEALPLRAGEVPAALLASGAWSAAVLSEHGSRLETLQLPVRTPSPAWDACALRHLSLKACFGSPACHPAWDGPYRLCR